MARGTAPRAGTVQRAVWNAMHRTWCGPDCPNGPGCRVWNPSERDQQAAIDAVRAFDAIARPGAPDHMPDCHCAPCTEVRRLRPVLEALRGLLEAMPGNDDKHEFEAALAHAQQVAWP